MSERDGLCPIMLILARFSKCILGTGFSAKKIHQNFRSLADLPDGAAKSNPDRPTKSTPRPTNPHTTPLQAITLISPPRPMTGTCRDPPMLPPARGPANPCRAAPLSDIPRLANTKSKQPTDASRSHRSHRTTRSNRPISRRCLPPAAQFCQPLPITISLATSPPRRTSPVLTYRQRTHHQPLLAKCCPTQPGRCRLQSCSHSANKAHLSRHGSSSATACLMLPGAAQPLSITILAIALPTRRTSPVLTFG